MKQGEIPEYKRIENAAAAAGCAVSPGRGNAEERLRAALLASGAGTFYWDLQTNDVDWDEGIVPLFGLAPGKAPARAGEFLQFLHPEDVYAVQAALAGAPRNGDDLRSSSASSGRTAAFTG